MENETSQQELDNLLNEDKITQSQYDDLLTAMSSKADTETVSNIAESCVSSKVSGLAVISLVLSIMTLVIGPFGFFPGIAFGHIARSKIRKNPNLKGSGLALAGLIVGYCLSPCAIFMTIMLLMQPVESEVSADFNRGFEAEEFRHFPIDSMEGIIAQCGLEFDKDVSIDGNGSIKIDVSQRTSCTFKLLETGPLDSNITKLVYQVHVLELDETAVTLVMYCELPGKKKSQSYSTNMVGYGTSQTDWRLYETTIELKEGECPQNVKLNVTLARGNARSGPVWIDDIRLLRSVE